MKEAAIAIAREGKNPIEKLNRLREYMQAFVLRSLHEAEAFNTIAFVGGTALRFLYGLPRFSEDLDFCLESKHTYMPKKWLAKLKRDMHFANFEASITWNENTIVHNGWVGVTGILKELGLSGHPDQKLSIKLEIDTRTPSGAVLKRQTINRHFLLAVQHHDLSSLMAGKIHALSCRPYQKGRDWYDLLWYRAQHPPVTPNLILLQHALDQTEKEPWQAETWRHVLEQKLSTLDWKRLTQDVLPFLERLEDRTLLTHTVINQALSE